MVLKDKIILRTLQKKDIPEELAFIILKYYKNMLDINIEIDIENSEIESSSKMPNFFILIYVYGCILIPVLLLILLVVLILFVVLSDDDEHSILDNI